ncbi:MAG: selenium-dependent molybdenum cofactor biosynthesis protein YqeB [Bacillota bacterium]
MNDIVVIRGGGDLATGIGQRLHNSGFRILVLEIETPQVIRRTVAFAQAVFDGSTVVEGIKAVKVTGVEQIKRAWDDGVVPVMIDKSCSILNQMSPDVVVDAILAKKNLGTHRGMAPITIGVGPGFEAGVDVDIVVETERGHDLGRLVYRGYAAKDSGIPGEIMGYGKERVIKSPCDGKIRHLCRIGDSVVKGQAIVMVGHTEVKASIDGVLRGLIMEGLEVQEGLKIADIDPRNIEEHCYTISDKARAIGGGVLEAILYMKKIYFK